MCAHIAFDRPHDHSITTVCRGAEKKIFIIDIRHPVLFKGSNTSGKYLCDEIPSVNVTTTGVLKFDVYNLEKLR